MKKTFFAVLLLGFALLGADDAQARWKAGSVCGGGCGKAKQEASQAKAAQFAEFAQKRPNAFSNMMLDQAMKSYDLAASATGYIGTKAEFRQLVYDLNFGVGKIFTSSVGTAYNVSASFLSWGGGLGTWMDTNGNRVSSLQTIFGQWATLNGNNNGKTLCLGWNCFIKVKGSGAGDSGFVQVTPPPGYVPPPSRAPSPTPGIATITSFEITNFKLQQAQNGVEYYQILKEQMAVAHPDYQLNIRWTVSGATSCTASCKYAKIDDYLANQNFDEIPSQTWPCNQNIDGQATFSGSVDKQVGTAKTKPRETGIIRYSLSCDGAVSDATAHLLAVIQDFNWFETIPVL